MSKNTKEIEKEKKLGQALSDATHAFWAVIAEEYPTATTGDLDFDIVIELDKAQRAAVARWIELNVKEE